MYLDEVVLFETDDVCVYLQQIFTHSDEDEPDVARLIIEPTTQNSVYINTDLLRHLRKIAKDQYDIDEVSVFTLMEVPMN